MGSSLGIGHDHATLLESAILLGLTLGELDTFLATLIYQEIPDASATRNSEESKLSLTANSLKMLKHSPRIIAIRPLIFIHLIATSAACGPIV